MINILKIYAIKWKDIFDQKKRGFINEEKLRY